MLRIQRSSQPDARRRNLPDALNRNWDTYRGQNDSPVAAYGAGRWDES